MRFAVRLAHSKAVRSCCQIGPSSVARVLGRRTAFCASPPRRLAVPQGNCSASPPAISQPHPRSNTIRLPYHVEAARHRKRG